MTPETLANRHARAFEGQSRAWSAEEFATLLSSPHVHLTDLTLGFAVFRVVADEAEILTLATDPSNRRQGVGRQLLEQVEQGATTANATTIFLEVSDRNIAAKALYKKAGYEETARRNDYYQEPDGGRADALILRKTL